MSMDGQGVGCLSPMLKPMRGVLCLNGTEPFARFGCIFSSIIFFLFALPRPITVCLCRDEHVETDECGAPEFFSNEIQTVVAHRFKIGGTETDPDWRSRQSPTPKDIIFQNLGDAITQPRRTVSLQHRRTGAISETCRATRFSTSTGRAVLPTLFSRLDAAGRQTWAGIDDYCLAAPKRNAARRSPFCFLTQGSRGFRTYDCKTGGALASKMTAFCLPLGRNA